MWKKFLPKIMFEWLHYNFIIGRRILTVIKESSTHWLVQEDCHQSTETSRKAQYTGHGRYLRIKVKFVSFNPQIPFGNEIDNLTNLPTTRFSTSFWLYHLKQALILPECINSNEGHEWVWPWLLCVEKVHSSSLSKN